MARKIIWTESAWRDLEEAANYIAKDSKYYAAALIRKARDTARSLATLSERGRIVSEFNNPEIRELFVGNFRLIYLIKNRIIYILGFIHGARDLWALWEREERPV